MSQHQQESSSGSLVGLDASKKISERLGKVARTLRFSTSSQSNLYKAVGLRPRLTDRLFSAAVVLVTLLNFVIPNVAAILYYGYFASDQYESEARFTVRSSTPAIGKDQLAKVTGLPSVKIVQDTQIVMNFIESHEMLDVLRRRNVDLEKVFGDTSIDRWSRLAEDATAEETLEYWSDMVSVGVSASSGIVTVKVRAFTAEDSAILVDEIVDASETVVNEVNDRIWKDVISTAETNLDNSKLQLEKARQAVADARNRDGVLTVESSAEIISHLVKTMEEERLALQQRYDAQLAVVSASAPQMRVLQREINSKEAQIAKLNAQVAGVSQAEPVKGSRNLAEVSQELSQLQLAQSLAEQQFASSVKTVEQVRFISRQQLLYLDSFLEPRIPDEALYPRRLLWISITLIASLIVWGVLLSLLYTVRSRLAR